MLNTNKKYVRQPFMLGEEPGIYDSINMDQEVFDLYKRAIAQMWTEDEFNYAPCKAEFAEDNDGKDLMVDTLKYQWRADSLACNLYTLLQPFISNDQITQLILFNTFMECLTPDHEVLTPKGWVGIADVKVGDKVMQFDPETKELSFVIVSHTVAKPVSEPLIHFTSRHFNQLVTPNHRLLAYGAYGYKMKGDKDYMFYEASEAPLHGCCHYPVSGFGCGSRTSLTPQEKFWIVFQADGHKVKDPRYNGKRVKGLPYRFSFKRKDKIEHFDTLLEELQWHYTYFFTSDGYKDYLVYTPFDEVIDNDVAKAFAWISLEDKSYSWCEEFCEYLMLWDGCKRYSNKCLGTYSNTNKAAIDMVQTIAHLGGYTGSIYHCPPQERRQKSYQVNITKRVFTTGNSISTELVPYDGLVYCITVPSGAFLVKHREIVQITGNCIHSGSYSEIVKNAFPDPVKTIEDLSADEISSDRLETVSKAFCDLRQVGLDYTLGKVTREEVYADVYKGVVALYLLERIQFICSFAVTFSLGELGRFQPVAMAVRKICADETVIHAETDLLILKDMQKDPLWESTNTPEFQETLTKMVDEVIGRECAWVDQVFEGRKLPGLTPELLKEWAMFNAQIVKDNLGLKHDGKHKVNPLPFLKGWISSNTTQVANQEQNDGVQYLIGGISNDTDDVDIDLDF